jgi:hypothetical protein
MKLVCFDFDDTLFHTPKPEEGKPIFLEKTGNDWPHRGWWGKSETIDSNIFNIPMNEWVFEKYQKHRDEENTKVIVATGRLAKVDGMLDNITKLFKENELKFDEVHLNWGGDTLRFKIKLFEQKLRELNVKEFIMFDDRFEHLPHFENWATEFSKQNNTKITVVDVVNKTEKTFER